MGVASLVLGIISILLSLVPIVGFVFAVIALIIAIIAMCSKKNKEKDRGLKIAGLVMSIISTITSFIIAVPLVIGAIIIAENNDKIIDKAEQAVNMSDVGAINDKLALAYVELKIYNPTVKEFDKYDVVIVDGITYYGLEDYYKSVVPETDKDSSEYLVPQGYEMVFESNGSAKIVKK